VAATALAAVCMRYAALGGFVLGVLSSWFARVRQHTLPWVVHHLCGTWCGSIPGSCRSCGHHLFAGQGGGGDCSRWAPALCLVTTPGPLRVLKVHCAVVTAAVTMALLLWGLCGQTHLLRQDVRLLLGPAQVSHPSVNSHSTDPQARVFWRW
jgi:hypothetical protein